MYASTMPNGAHRLDAGPRPPRSDDREATPISLRTNGLVNRDARYSYTQTPSELQRPTFLSASSPVNSTIEESDGNISNHTVHNPNTQFPTEKAPVTSSDMAYNLKPPLHEVHPALYAPFAEPLNSSEDAHVMNVRQSAGPLPSKIHDQSTSPVYNSTHTQRDAEPTRPTSVAIHGPNYYNPDSLAGPNLTLENHRPGQVSHPNAMVDPKWKHGLCEVDTLCCIGLLCPCVLYGKTQYRLSKRDQKQDPTDLLSYETVNGSCGIMAAACGLQCKWFSYSRCGKPKTKKTQGYWLQSNERDYAKCIRSKGV